MRGNTKTPVKYKLKAQFTDTGLAGKNNNGFRGDINQFMNRVLGLSIEAQKFVYNLTVERFQAIMNKLTASNEIDPETKGNNLYRDINMWMVRDWTASRLVLR
jgi:hypothetical protein